MYALFYFRSIASSRSSVLLRVSSCCCLSASSIAIYKWPAVTAHTRLHNNRINSSYKSASVFTLLKHRLNSFLFTARPTASWSPALHNECVTPSCPHYSPKAYIFRSLSNVYILYKNEYNIFLLYGFWSLYGVQYILIVERAGQRVGRADRAK